MRSALAPLLLALGLLLFAGCNNPYDKKDAPPELEESGIVVPGDALFERQWGHNAVSASELWGLMSSSELDGGFEPVVVAVIDSLIDTDHPDLQSMIAPGGWDFRQDRSIATSLLEETPSFHGTHVAGIIAATYDNGIGIAGIGRNYVRILPVRVLEETSSGITGNTSDLLEALVYAAGLNAEHTPPQSAVVINMSLGSREPLGDAVASVIDSVRQSGVVMVGASGNQNFDSLDYPAAYDSVISVGSVDYDGNTYVRSSFLGGSDSGSTYGPGLDLVAPGGLNESTTESILSTIPAIDIPASEAYGFEQGTSMATPYVTAIAAILYSWDLNITPEGVRRILRETATDLQVSGIDIETGWGLVDANRAFRRRLMAPYGPYELEEAVITYKDLSESMTMPQIPQHNQMLDAGAVSSNSEVVPGSFVLTLNQNHFRKIGTSAGLAELSAILALYGGEIVEALGAGHFEISFDEVNGGGAIDALVNWALIDNVEPNRRITFRSAARRTNLESETVSVRDVSAGAGELPAISVISSGSRSGIREAAHVVLESAADLDRLPQGTAAALHSQLRNALKRYPRVLLITAGNRPTGGYGVEFVSSNGDGESLGVTYKVNEPDPDDLVSQAITTPYLLLGVGIEEIPIQVTKRQSVYDT